MSGRSREAKAARFYKANTPMKLESVQLRAMGDDDVYVEVKAAGICHSELHSIRGRTSPAFSPITMGHEASGIIAEKGRNVKNVEIGDRVGIDYILSCGKCRYCIAGKDNLCDNFTVMSFNIDGSWATGAVVPARHVHKLPKNLGFPEGAIMNCSVFTAYHANKLAETSAGDSVAVYGLGGVGISVLQWTKLFGANEIIAIDAEEGKLQLAKEKGATLAINAKDFPDPVKKVKELSDGGVDIAFEVIGRVDTTRRTIECVRKGGKAVLVGMCFENWPMNTVNDLQVPEVKVMSPQDHLMSEIPQVLKFIETGRYDFKNVVTHRLPLEDVNKGIEILDKRIGNPGRVVLEP